MSARILEGKHIASALRKEIKTEVEELSQLGVVPALTMIRVGQDPASLIYMNAKARASAEVGMRSAIAELPADSSEERIRILLEEIGQNKSIHGVIVQLPLPPHLDTLTILSLMSPEKDVDGFHPINAGRLSMGEPLFVPATPLGIKELLDKNGISVDGAHVVIIGRSNIVGRPLANYLGIKRSGLNATVTICHSSTRNLEKITRCADILVSAIGSAEFVGSSMVSPGTVVVDVGMNRIVDSSSPSGTRLVGDVKFDEVKEVASAITPVPGGVGPMTVAMLLKNAVKACRMQTRT
jgi:methylenetetrahydrofolate dehydrogenase (NADP+) / methenyltetrahydrofolate cyclohydrolase